jgi:hypothetical protein
MCGRFYLTAAPAEIRKQFNAYFVDDRNLPGQRNNQRRRNGADIETGSEWLALEQQPAAYYRAAAERARRLQAEATTPRLKQYLGEVIERSERLAEEVESASEKD